MLPRGVTPPGPQAKRHQILSQEGGVPVKQNGEPVCPGNQAGRIRRKDAYHGAIVPQGRERGTEGATAACNRVSPSDAHLRERWRGAESQPDCDGPRPEWVVRFHWTTGTGIWRLVS